MIGIIDYGSGNLRSVSNALRREGAEVSLVGSPEQLETVQAVVLLFAMTYVLINLAIDLLYMALDPRIRY